MAYHTTGQKSQMFFACGLVSAIQGDIYEVPIFKNCLKLENYSISSVFSSDGRSGFWGVMKGELKAKCKPDL